MSAHLRVIAPGLATSVQDAGRFGYQRFGMPTAGVLDRLAMAAANTIVGNAPDMAVLEMLYLGATLEVGAESVRVACVGLGASLEVVEEGGTRQVPGGVLARCRRQAGSLLLRSHVGQGSRDPSSPHPIKGSQTPLNRNIRVAMAALAVSGAPSPGIEASRSWVSVAHQVR